MYSVFSMDMKRVELTQARSWTLFCKQAKAVKINVLSDCPAPNTFLHLISRNVVHLGSQSAIHSTNTGCLLVGGPKDTQWWARPTTAAAAKSLRSCPTLCDPIGGSPPGSAVPGILQARTLEWVAISSSNAGKWKVKVKSLSRVQLLATPWTAAYQVPPSMGSSRQEYWSGVPFPLTVPKLLRVQWGWLEDKQAMERLAWWSSG